MQRFSTFGRTQRRILNNNGPYRTPSPPPKEDLVMSENYRITKLVITAAVISITVMCGTCAFNSNYHPTVVSIDLEKAKFDTARVKAEAERERAEADKEMFKHMNNIR